MGKFSIEIRWAVIFTAVSVIWMIVEKSLGWHDVHIADHAKYTNFFAFPAIVLYILALRDKKKVYYKDEANWKQLFVSGVYMSGFVALFSPMAQYVSFTYVSPDFFKNMIDHVVLHNQMTREQALAYFNLKSYLSLGIFGALSMGVITSAVVALFLRTKKTK